MNILSLILRGTRELGLVTLWDSITYLIRKRWYQIRFARSRRIRAPDSSDYLRPDPVTSHAHQGQTVTITCANGSYALTILAPDLICVRFQPIGHLLPSSLTPSPSPTPNGLPAISTSLRQRPPSRSEPLAQNDMSGSENTQWEDMQTPVL